MNVTSTDTGGPCARSACASSVTAVPRAADLKARFASSSSDDVRKSPAGCPSRSSMLPPYSRAAAAFARTIVPSGASASIGSGLYSKIERKRSSLASSDAVASTNALMSFAVMTTPTMLSPTRIGAVDVVTGNVEPSVRCMRSDSLTVSPSSTRLNDDRPIQPLSSAIRSPYARPTSVEAGAPNVRCAAALACVTIPCGSISSIASPALVNTERKRCSFWIAIARVRTMSVTSSTSDTIWNDPSIGMRELNQRQCSTRPSFAMLRFSVTLAVAGPDCMARPTSATCPTSPR